MKQVMIFVQTVKEYVREIMIISCFNRLTAASWFLFNKNFHNRVPVSLPRVLRRFRD